MLHSATWHEVCSKTHVNSNIHEGKHITASNSSAAFKPQMNMTFKLTLQSSLPPYSLCGRFPTSDYKLWLLTYLPTYANEQSPSEYTVPVYSASTQCQYTVPVHSASIQCQYTVPVQCQYTVPVHSASIQCQYTVPVYSASTQCQCTVPVYSASVQCQCTVPVYSASVQC
jgi:hypothetical protein